MMTCHNAYMLVRIARGSVTAVCAGDIRAIQVPHVNTHDVFWNGVAASYGIGRYGTRIEKTEVVFVLGYKTCNVIARFGDTGYNGTSAWHKSVRTIFQHVAGRGSGLGGDPFHRQYVVVPGERQRIVVLAAATGHTAVFEPEFVVLEQIVGSEFYCHRAG